MMLSRLKYLTMAVLALNGLCASSAYALASQMASLSDDELSQETGQALMSLSYIAPTDTQNLMRTRGGGIGFYRLGLEAEVELNANIKNLQLGCGGTNNAVVANACDIDIKNLSLSGLYDSLDADGNPVFNNGRPSKSAILTNPFMEFAIKDPDKASTREIVGFRASAEKISGLLTAGLANNLVPSTTDGIQRLSGFMRIAATSGAVNTLTSTFGKQNDQIVNGNVRIIGLIDSSFSSLPNDPITLGVTIPSMPVSFNTPAFQVNGQRQASAVIEGINVTLSSIPLANGPNNLLRVRLNPTVLGVEYARVRLKAGSAVQNLNLSIDFMQSLSMIHNIPLTGTGGYLALQKNPLLWPGNYIDPADTSKTDLSLMTKSDVAKQGWWMSFAEPVQLGFLQAANDVDISAVFPQVAALMNAELAKDSQRINLGLGEAFNALTNQIIETPDPLVVDLNNATNPLLGGTPASILLQNLKLKNQEVVPNCYGTLTFC